MTVNLASSRVGNLSTVLTDSSRAFKLKPFNSIKNPTTASIENDKSNYEAKNETTLQESNSLETVDMIKYSS